MAALAVDLGASPEPHRHPTQTCGPAGVQRAFELERRRVEVTRAQQRIPRVAQRRHEQSGRTAALGGAHGTDGDIYRPVVLGVTQQGVGLVDEHARELDEVTGSLGSGGSLGEMGVPSRTGRGVRGGDMSGGECAVVADLLGDLQRLHGHGLGTLTQQSEGIGPQRQHMDPVDVDRNGIDRIAQLHGTAKVAQHVLDHPGAPGQRRIDPVA